MFLYERGYSMKEIIYLEMMPKDMKIVTKDMIIVGTGEKYTPKEVTVCKVISD